MTIRNMMTTDVSVIPPDLSLQEAARIMRDGDLGSVPVVEHDQLVGMVTDRDLVIRAVAEDRRPAGTEVRQVMTEGVAYCFDDDDPSDVAEMMARNRVRRLAVVTHDKRLVGMISLGDLSAQGAAQKAGNALGEIARAP